MPKSTTISLPKTAADYHRAFTAECARDYPAVSDFEERAGFAVDRARLEAAARVLACPIKANPPSWQHGRVLYAAARRALKDNPAPGGIFLDIGTAKGFSAVVMTWAIADAGARHHVLSVDVVAPDARVPRNSVLEVTEGLKTVHEFTAPFARGSIEFHGCGSVLLLQRLQPGGERVRFAFVDGKHSYEAVHAEIRLLSVLQRSGDVIVFDDLQIPGIGEAVAELRGYTVDFVRADKLRAYAVAVRD